MNEDLLWIPNHLSEHGTLFRFLRGYTFTPINVGRKWMSLDQLFTQEDSPFDPDDPERHLKESEDPTPDNKLFETGIADHPCLRRILWTRTQIERTSRDNSEHRRYTLEARIGFLRTQGANKYSKQRRTCHAFFISRRNQILSSHPHFP